MSKVMRSVKNVTKGYSSVQVKVRDATSNDPWGPTGTQMQEISQMTYNSANEFYEIMDMLDKRLNDKGKNWRHVLKALKVLDYCLHEGSELVVTWARKNIFVVKTLREFQYTDEDGRDVGQNVRVSAKELTSLIMDEERLRLERSDRKSWKSRVTGIEEFGGPNESPARDRPRQQRAVRPQRADEEDAEYRLAIEASKYQEEEDRKKRQSKQGGGGEDDDDLAKALQLSREEEELRRRELEEQNAASLFDDDPIQTAQPNYTGYNQGYQQGNAIDWSGNPLDQNNMMQGQPTGYMGMQGFGQQPTGYQNGFANGFGAQPTGYDAFGQGQQQTPQFATQPTSYNPYGQQPQQNFGQDMFGQQSQPEAQFPASTNNPWATSNTAQPLKPTPTGSNNPFASASSQPKPSPFSTPQKATLDILQEQKSLSQFNNTSNFNPSTSFAQQFNPQKSQSPYEAKLSALLESGDGMDTFGNTGNLRIPAQHTAPGTFVNSAGAGINALHAQQTGSNPYMQSQFTGMPQTSYGGQASPFGAGHQVAAATGPANMGYGGQNNNPFGQRPQQQQGGGDLIQF